MGFDWGWGDFREGFLFGGGLIIGILRYMMQFPTKTSLIEHCASPCVRFIHRFPFVKISDPSFPLENCFITEMAGPRTVRTRGRRILFSIK